MALFTAIGTALGASAAAAAATGAAVAGAAAAAGGLGYSMYRSASSYHVRCATASTLDQATTTHTRAWN